MPHRLKERQRKIQEKRKQTPWREFVKEIASWYQITFYKVGGKISRYPDTDRIGSLLSSSDFFEQMLDQPVTLSGEHGLFEGLSLLMKSVNLPELRHWGSAENSNFSDTCFLAKNCYMSTTVCFDVENVLYSHHVAGNCTDVLNSVFVATNSSNVYASSTVVNSYNIFFSSYIMDCSYIWHGKNLTGCSECLGCYDLNNASYCIENVQYEKSEYLQKKDERITSHVGHQNLGSITSGEMLFRCENVSDAMFCADVHEGKNIIMASRDDAGGKEKLYDVMSTGGVISHAYGCMGVSPGEHFYCCVNCANCSHVFYSMFLGDCSYCLGCIGLKNKSYCIFNKQYTKEKRYDEIDKIFAKMEHDGNLGKFFPGSVNPFYFNDTAAALIEDFTKQEVLEAGYMRREKEIKIDIPERMEVVDVSELGKYEGWKIGTKNISSVQVRTQNIASIPEEAIRHIDPSILKKVIRDEEGNVYRVVKMEYDFLMKHGLPLPREHRLERVKYHFTSKQGPDIADI